MSGSEDKRARGPVAPRGIVCIVEKARTSNVMMLLPSAIEVSPTWLSECRRRS